MRLEIIYFIIAEMTFIIKIICYIIDYHDFDM